jgi:Gpi18-like mannosyltransferase/4-amino-4-deoxy-L-arabinose transferase-like glycosyltransferase
MTARDPSHRPAAIQRETSGRRKRLSGAGLLLLCAVATFVLVPARAHAQSLVQNGSFTDGEGSAPSGWGTEAWSQSARTAFDWLRSPAGVGVVVVRNPEPNDARWRQVVPVAPNTWYRLSGWLRAIGVAEGGAGASLSPVEGFDRGRVVVGEDSGWQPVAMWFKTGPGQTSVAIACRLGSFGRTVKGEARCTGVDLTAQARPPLNADFVYGPLDEATAPVGLPASFLLVGLLAYGLWRYGRLPSGVALRERLALDGFLLLVLAIKIGLAPVFQYKIDVNAYAAWALRLADEGPARFYAPGYFADYPPGYMYVLWWVGLASRALRLGWQTSGFLVLLKLPALLADFAVARLLFARLRGAAPRAAWLAALAFALNPALVLDSAVWGQTDSVLSLLVLLAFLAQGERHFELAWVFAALAVLTKPQALLLVPLLAFWPWGWWMGGRPLSAALAAVATAFVVADPFRGDRPWRWLVDLYSGTAGYYNETSVNAMNLMALAFGMRRNDADLFLGLSAQIWGFVLGGVVGLAFLIPYLRRRTRVLHAALIASATLVSFLCLTRMHERYLYPFFTFAGLLGVTGPVGFAYWALSALFFANELAVYLYQDGATAGPPWLWGTVAGLSGGALVAWLVAVWRMASGRVEPPGAPALADDDRRWQEARAEADATAAARSAGGHQPAAPAREPSWSWREVAVLAALTAVAAGIRLYGISHPTDLVFDEVYFVEQARNYLHGQDFMDPHPPIAKLTIGLGIALFGDHPIGWRVMNAIAGTALVPLMYLLARALFLRPVAAGLAAFLIAIDGLCIVDSRIAVIDIHYVMWAIAAYVALIRLIRARRFESTWRLLAIGGLIGLSVGAKLYIPFFSFLLVLGALALAARTTARERGSPVLRFVARPVLIVGAMASITYVLSYTPHFLWGWWSSPLDLVKYIVIKVPEYQEAVKTMSHPYSSKWWTWPLLLRPVWYYWKDPAADPGTVVGIWGAGNPPVWWASVPALGFAAWIAWRERRAALAFVLAGWAIHLAPWVPISRTLFLYHYFPSFLFALLALAWLLDRLWAGEGSTLERGLVGAILLGSILPVCILAAPSWAPVAFIAALVAYAGAVFSQRTDPARVGRAAVLAYCVAVAMVSGYLLPIWLGLPIEKAAWNARMWIRGTDLMNWI